VKSLASVRKWTRVRGRPLSILHFDLGVFLKGVLLSRSDVVGWWAPNLVRGFYVALLLGLALYALHALVLMVLYLWHRKAPSLSAPSVPEEALPWVTVQVPLRNERHVVGQVLKALGALSWPRDRLELQVLDDSDDVTTALAEEQVTRLHAQGLQVELLHRDDPDGYKAGALSEGLRRARGEFIVIFDADFCPDPDFLRQTVPHLVADPGLGMVQARWTHLNQEYSVMTRVQALALDAHFSVEHLARSRSGLLMNFNGSAGVWRRAAIHSAGGWQDDTVTEDLDLSYRAQLAGWRVCYLPDVVAAAELPPLLASIKTQQVRWAKGASQVFRKLAGPIVRSPRLTLVQKVMALLHLSGYITQPLILAMMLLTLPMVLTAPAFSGFIVWLSALASIPPLLYVLGQMHFHRDWYRRILIYPVMMFLWIGLAWSLSLAVCDGLLHRGGAFIRTPKFSIHGRRGDWRRSDYRPRGNRSWIGELCIGIYVCIAAWAAFTLDHKHLIPLVLSYVLAEVILLGLTLVQSLPANR
jgi:cellulose synthase/poly-beta-1,6-N-acetylglucosamine synthase-like glycosyltransferase